MRIDGAEIKRAETPEEARNAIVAVTTECASTIQIYAQCDPDGLATKWTSLPAESRETFIMYWGPANPVGILLALFVPCMITGLKQALEYLWLVRPAFRAKGSSLKLLEAFEREARIRGCAQMVVGNSAWISPDRMARMYKLRGYKPHASVFSKEVQRG
jgi:GNAT superfamily N-acetyltransferase